MSKIIKSNLTDKIFDYITEQILSGKWAANSKIPSETELAETLGVSRMSLRMAIQKTNVLGLTETLVGEGTFVRDFSMRNYFTELYNSKILTKDYNEINDFRMILQIGSIRLAFEKPTFKAESEKLERIYYQMEAAAADENVEKFNYLDSQFHQTVCELSDNLLMSMLYDAIHHTFNEATAQNVQHSVKTSGSYELVLKFHKTILEGIKEKNIQKCIDAEMEARVRSFQYYRKLSE